VKSVVTFPIHLFAPIRDRNDCSETYWFIWSSIRAKIQPPARPSFVICFLNDFKGHVAHRREAIDYLFKTAEYMNHQLSLALRVAVCVRFQSFAQGTVVSKMGSIHDAA
jgi:hypothetical protein